MYHRAQIAKEKEILDEAVGRLEESQTLIQQTEKKWLPKLERLVSEISEKFTASFDSALLEPISSTELLTDRSLP